jgi:lysylphosphatidylglycerol synthetase-like protein (DUF2156 family)
MRPLDFRAQIEPAALSRARRPLTVTAILVVVVNVLVCLALALRLGNAASVAFVATLVASILVSLLNSLVIPVRNVALLLFAAVVMVSRGHQRLL